MEKPDKYIGVWPKNTVKTAKYSVRRNERIWKVSINFDTGEGQKTLFSVGKHEHIVELVNNVKLSFGQKEGGVFYINEYKHIIVPISNNKTSEYYFAAKISDKVDANFRFKYKGKFYSTKPISKNGRKLKPGDEWSGPRPGISYKILADGTDISRRYINLINNKITKKERSNIKKGTLLNECSNKSAAKENIKMIRDVKGNRGGVVYVNENRAVFVPMDSAEDGLNFFYCGELNMKGWFPEPNQK